MAGLVAQSRLWEFTFPVSEQIPCAVRGCTTGSVLQEHSGPVENWEGWSSR